VIDKRNVIFAVLVFLAPIVVAWYGLSVAAAAGLVVLLLLGRWLDVFPRAASCVESLYGSRQEEL
jgi:hypothetical protein